MPIETWFPSVIFFEDLEVDSHVKSQVLEAINERTEPIKAAAENLTAVTAANAVNDLHLDPRLSPLLSLFAPPLKRFFFDSLHFDPQMTDFHMGRCWPVVDGGGELSGSLHVHHGAVFSGVFYLRAPEGSGALQFHKPYIAPHDGIEKTGWCDLTYVRAEYPAVENRLMVFSSNMEHRRLPSIEAASGERIAISFDLYSTVDLVSKGGGMPRHDWLRRIV